MGGLRGPRTLLAILALLTASPAAVQAATGTAEMPVPERRIVLQDGTDLPGGDLQQLFNTTQDACVQVCLADQSCTALTYNARSRACFPKGTGAGDPAPFVGAVSGRVIPAADGLLAAARSRAASAAAWLTDDDLERAFRQAERLGAVYPANGEAIDTLRDQARDAGAANDAAAVVRWMGAATAQSDDPADWLSLSQWLAEAADRDGGGEAETQGAMAAALNSWLRDPGAGSLAIQEWAELAEKQGRGRAGLQALRQAAAVDSDPDLKAALAGFEARNGFRVEDTQVDSDAPAPRVCAQMSEDLAPAVDYRSFVALPDPALAVEADGRQLCISGVAHGQDLRLTLRKGMPAASGEVLARDIPLQLYVRDRSPQARFAGRAYLLPAGGDQGLTVRTVNTDAVDLALYRMSDRNLVTALRQDIFGQPLDGWKRDSFTDAMGQRIWSGQADIAPTSDGTPHPVNEEVATRLDIARTAGPLAPGIYALTAAVPGQSEERSPPATQWFMISDLGLSSYAGTDGLVVAVRGIGDAAPRTGLAVQLISRGNAILGTTQTDAEGIARFDAGLTRGRDAAAPAMITATAGEGESITDMAFLSLVEPEFDLSDRGVEGQPPAPPIDLFATTDRGAYRAGETVHATILARDEGVRALDGLPLTAVILRPDGVEASRSLVPPQGDGGYVLDWRIPDTAPRGGWRIDLKVEADGPALTSMRVLIEDFRPERIDLTLNLPDAPLSAAQPLQAGLTARWLYDAPGADLPVEGSLRLEPATALPGWDGYVFGRYDAPDDSDVVTLDPGQTDAEGRWQTTMPVPPALSAATRPMDAIFQLAVREGAGRPVERRETRLVMPSQPVIGIRPGFQGDAVAEGSEAPFSVVALGPDLRPVAAEARWVLNKVQTDYQWYALDGEWSWEPVTTRARVSEGTLSLTADAPAPLSLPVPWGEFELVVTAADGAQTATRFWAGWGAAATGSDTPDRMLVTLDKPAYRAGDTARVTMQAAADGVALVSVLKNRVVSLQTVAVKAGANTMDLPVTEEWGAGVYVAVSAIRPLGEAGPAAGGHAPVRAMGLAHAGVDPGDRKLQATLTAPAETTPRGTAEVRLAVNGAAPGAVVHATIAAVDQGILNLTGFTPPDPSGHYFGQRRLGVGLRDLYGRLILPSGATDGAIRSGGDAAGGGNMAPPPTEKLMAWFSGPLTVGADGTVTVPVPLPDFNGSVRLMAVVWSAGAVGQADAVMLVRDPVVMVVTAPAFLAPGDRAEVGVALTHVSGPTGEVRLTTEVGADGPPLGLADLPTAVTLAEKERADTRLTLTAPDEDGVAHLRLSATLPGGGVVTKDLAITIERQDPVVTRAARITLAPGETATLDRATLGGFRPGTGRSTLTSGAFAQLDLGAAITRLATYPYGCTEQLASRGMPLLFLDDLMPTAAAMAPDAEDDRLTIEDAVAQILTRQASSGGFGLWTAEPGDPWLDAFVTDFLSRARAAGHTVPDEPFRRASNNLQNNLNAASEPQYADASDNAALAYAAYVLAREHAAVISDLRYYVDTASAQFATPMAAAQMGAAMAFYGDVARADAMFERAQTLLAEGDKDDASALRGDYGTRLRDTAAALALAAEAGTQRIDRPATATALAGMIAARHDTGADLSTQEALWTVLAGHALQSGPGAGNALRLDGAPVAGPMIDLGDAGQVTPLSLSNGGTASLDVTLSTTAVPDIPPPAGGTAFAITRRYVTPEGLPADPAQVAQGTRLVAILEVTPLADGSGRLIVTDPLPAGFEIDNPNLIAAGELAGLDFLGGMADTQMTEFRQDRFAAAVRWSGDAPFTLAYRLRAVTPGAFHHPAATVEDMYRPERRGWTDSGRVEIAR